MSGRRRPHYTSLGANWSRVHAGGRGGRGGEGGGTNCYTCRQTGLILEWFLLRLHFYLKLDLQKKKKKKKEIRPDFKRPHRLKDELNVVQLHLSLRLFSHYGVIKWDEDGISRPRAAFPGSRRRAISANYNLMADWSLVLYFCPFMV